MQEPTITPIDKSRVELRFVVTTDEAKPYLDQAAQDLQTQKPIKGFRPGKAPYDAAKAAFGEMKILETALERIVRSRYVHAVLEKNLETVGSPEISVDSLTPGQDIAFTVRAAVMPTVEKIADYSKTLVTRSVPEIKDDVIEHALGDLQKMRRKETVTDAPANRDGVVEIDMEMKDGNVVVEGGSAHKYRVFLNEEHYIPGFADQLVGMKRGEEKTFELSLPKDHYQKHLAGKPLTFTVKVSDVYELTLPELDDAFAQELGIETLQALKDKLRENLREESRMKAEEAAEIELLETMIKTSRFSEMPEILVQEEVRRMYDELLRAAEAQGMRREDYLAQLKKSPEEIKLDMIPRAIQRIKSSLLIRAIADKEGVAVSDGDLDTEIDHILKGLQDKELRERVSSPEYREYLAGQMKNQKTLALLKEKAVTFTP